MLNIRFSLPLIIFLGIAFLLLRGLSLHPTQVPSPLINKPTPHFELPTLLDTKKTTSEKDFLGQVTLMNVWATWCYTCADEHAFLTHIAQQEKINLYGFNYKDDTSAAKTWLEKFGNPYKIIAVDKTGNTAIDFGVYGTPETFIIDKKGKIRYKHIGPVTQEAWENKLKPLVLQLQSETA